MEDELDEVNEAEIASSFQQRYLREVERLRRVEKRREEKRAAEEERVRNMTADEILAQQLNQQVKKDKDYKAGERAIKKEKKENCGDRR